VAFITVTALVVARVAKAGLGQATSVFAAQRPDARATLLSNLLAFSLVMSLAVGGVVVAAIYLLGAEPAGTDRSQLPILMAGIVAASLVDDNFLIGCGRLREAAAISATRPRSPGSRRISRGLRCSRPWGPARPAWGSRAEACSWSPCASACVRGWVACRCS
jgi:hypothetical protein